MKGKTLLCLAMLLSVALTLVPALAAPAPPYMELVFESNSTNSLVLDPCNPPVENILVDMKMHGVTAMWGWATTITWNPAVLNCMDVIQGPFNPQGTSLLFVIDNGVGTIARLAAGTTAAKTVTGDGIVATLNFTAIAHGISNIGIENTVYVDYPAKVEHAVNNVNATFECRQHVGPPAPPVASFTPPTCTQFRLDKTTGLVTVNFDASTSTGSYDPLPAPGTNNPITEYQWDLTGDGVVDYVSSADNITVAVSVANEENYFYAGDPYYMGWAFKFHFDATKYEFLGSEKGPFPNVTGGTLEVNYTGGDVISVFGTLALVNVTNPVVIGSGIIDFMYFKMKLCSNPSLTQVVGTLSDCFISTWKYVSHPPVPQIHETPADAGFSYASAIFGPTATWTYNALNPLLAITLTVVAPDCDPSQTHADFVDHASVTNYIHVLPPIMGPDIDVYTQKGGIGKGCDKDTGVEYPSVGTPPFQTWTAMSDSFGPQELVTICAKVTYNDEPVENKLVAFEVWDNHDNSVIYREAATDANGIACVSFRIPWKGPDAEGEFGAWLIIATVDIAQHVVMDKCRFRFGYLVYINTVQVYPASLYKYPATPSDLNINITLGNIALTSKDVFVTVVLYDECGVPINHFGSMVTVTPVSKECPIVTLTIPHWAFVGTGRVYVNVFDYPPYEMGTPMCPENSAATFQILNTP